MGKCGEEHTIIAARTGIFHWWSQWSARLANSRSRPATQNLSDNGIVLGVGDVRVDLQYEWRYSTENNWQFAGFTDAGNVWLHGAEASPGEAWGWGDFSSWGWSAGAGIRYDLEFFILRLDAAARLHDPTQPAGIRWLGQSGFNGSIHLGLGLPF